MVHVDATCTGSNPVDSEPADGVGDRHPPGSAHGDDRSAEISAIQAVRDDAPHDREAGVLGHLTTGGGSASLSSAGSGGDRGRVKTDQEEGCSDTREKMLRYERVSHTLGNLSSGRVLACTTLRRNAAALVQIAARDCPAPFQCSTKSCGRSAWRRSSSARYHRAGSNGMTTMVTSGRSLSTS